MSPSTMKKNLQNPVFRAYLEAQGYDPNDLDNQLQSQQEDQQDKGLEDMSPNTLKNNLKSEDFRQMLIEQGIDIEELEKTIEDQGQNINEQQEQNEDGEDPLELRKKLINDPAYREQLVAEGYDMEQLQNQLDECYLKSLSQEEFDQMVNDEEFRKMLQRLGYDMGGQQQEQNQEEEMNNLENGEIDLQNMDPQQLAENLQDPKFIKLIESQGYDVQSIMDQLYGIQDNDQ